jgi:hypothetical protein
MTKHKSVCTEPCTFRCFFPSFFWADLWVAAGNTGCAVAGAAHQLAVGSGSSQLPAAILLILIATCNQELYIKYLTLFCIILHYFTLFYILILVYILFDIDSIDCVNSFSWLRNANVADVQVLPADSERFKRPSRIQKDNNITFQKTWHEMTLQHCKPTDGHACIHPCMHPSIHPSSILVSQLVSQSVS